MCHVFVTTVLKGLKLLLECFSQMTAKALVNLGTAQDFVELLKAHV